MERYKRNNSYEFDHGIKKARLLLQFGCCFSKIIKESNGKAGENMREMEFKMERPGLLTEGEKVTVTEGLLPSNYYYTIDPSLAMSGNVPFPKRLKTKEGTVKKIIKNDRGFYVTVEFEET